MDNIGEVRARLRAIPALEKRREALESRLRQAEAAVDELLRRYREESLDVERIRRESFSAFLLRALGKYEDRLEKECREELAAREEYDRAVAALDGLRAECAELAGRLEELYALARRYGAALEERRRRVQALPGEPGERYRHLEEEGRALAAQMTEIDEALRVADRAKATAYEAVDALESAEGWATWDMWSKGGIISHAAKYSHVDRAEACLCRLSAQLRELQAELADVRGLSAALPEGISPGLRAADFWLDNIFTDWIVRARISDNLDRARELAGAISALEGRLSARRREVAAALERNYRAGEDLLVSLDIFPGNGGNPCN